MLKRERIYRLKTALLIGEANSGSKEISIQISHVEIGGEQSIHAHSQCQCYYIIAGNGKMIIEKETQDVKIGDAVFIPGNSKHGIQNSGDKTLTYLTANQAFGINKENEIWKDSCEFNR